MPDFLVFLSKHNRVTSDHISLLWESARGRHDSLVFEIYSVITGIVRSLPNNLNKELCEKMLSVHLSDYDDKFIKLIRDFTHKMLDSRFIE